MNKSFASILVLFLLSITIVHAKVYKCKDHKGSINYTDEPCKVLVKDDIAILPKIEEKIEINREVNTPDFSDSPKVADKFDVIICNAEPVETRKDCLNKLNLPKEEMNNLQKEIIVDKNMSMEVEKKIALEEKLVLQRKIDYRKRLKQREEDRRNKKIMDRINRKYNLGSLGNHSKSMSFNDCLNAQMNTISSLGVSPINIIPIINHKDQTVTRICTVKGSVLITCDRLARKMIIVNSYRHEDVGCF